MCGRYELHATPREIQDHFGELISAERWRRFTAFCGYNIAPSLSVPIIRYSAKMAERSIDRAVWGFRPQWAKRAWINARAETLFTATAFRESAAKRRCLVPATGWYEWRDTGERAKQPYYIHLDRVFAFAGIWVPRKTDLGWEMNFAIVTADAVPSLHAIHPRMPVVMQPRHYAAWLDPATEDAASLMEPLEHRALAAYPVSTAVNDPRHDAPDCIAPVADERVR